MIGIINSSSRKKQTLRPLNPLSADRGGVPCTVWGWVVFPPELSASRDSSLWFHAKLCPPSHILEPQCMCNWIEGSCGSSISAFLKLTVISTALLSQPYLRVNLSILYLPGIAQECCQSACMDPCCHSPLNMLHRVTCEMQPNSRQCLQFIALVNFNPGLLFLWFPVLTLLMDVTYLSYLAGTWVSYGIIVFSALKDDSLSGIPTPKCLPKLILVCSTGCSISITTPNMLSIFGENLSNLYDMTTQKLVSFI